MVVDEGGEEKVVAKRPAGAKAAREAGEEKGAAAAGARRPSCAFPAFHLPLHALETKAAS